MGRPAPPPEAALEDALAQRPDAVHALPDGPTRFEIEQRLGGRGGLPGFARRFSWFLMAFPYMQRMRRDIAHTFTSVNANPPQPRPDITPDLLRRFSDRAAAYGVGAVGYTPLPPEAVFRDKGVLYDQAIVLIKEMDAAKMGQAPSRTTYRMVMQTYYDLGRVTNTLTDFLRRNGHAAQAGHPLNGVALYPLIAQRAGLGWCGSHGLLITPQYGPRQRIAVIYTDIRNLPAPAGNPHAWISELCARCRQCARFCPGRAIYDQPIPRPAGILTHIDVEKCFPVFEAQYGCSVCVKVCPFNLHPYEKVRAGYQHGARTRIGPGGSG